MLPVVCSQPMNKRRSKHSAEDDTPEDLEQWGAGSPDEEGLGEVPDMLWQLMEDVQLDARARRFIWPDGKRLSFAQATQRIRAQHKDLSPEEIERSLISWIENYAPAGASDDQLDELDILLDQWVDELEEISD